MIFQNSIHVKAYFKHLGPLTRRTFLKTPENILGPQNHFIYIIFITWNSTFNNFEILR